mmetsp:Transcript_8667/g.24758  ORF Transcript_8667/g.24758 Transcript_8667/m.24758 type:complete len:363 (-) Transcript_8667:243-1331(-)
MITASSNIDDLHAVEEGHFVRRGPVSGDRFKLVGHTELAVTPLPPHPERAIVKNCHSVGAAAPDQAHLLDVTIKRLHLRRGSEVTLAAVAKLSVCVTPAHEKLSVLCHRGPRVVAAIDMGNLFASKRGDELRCCDNSRLLRSPEAKFEVVVVATSEDLARLCQDNEKLLAAGHCFHLLPAEAARGHGCGLVGDLTGVTTAEDSLPTAAPRKQRAIAGHGSSERLAARHLRERDAARRIDFVGVGGVAFAANFSGPVATGGPHCATSVHGRVVELAERDAAHALPAKRRDRGRDRQVVKRLPLPERPVRGAAHAEHLITHSAQGAHLAKGRHAHRLYAQVFVNPLRGELVRGERGDAELAELV